VPTGSNPLTKNLEHPFGFHARDFNNSVLIYARAFGDDVCELLNFRSSLCELWGISDFKTAFVKIGSNAHPE
ncbi:MAG TPA: hypothetical protein VJS37_20020, partial [Terriglobales bacterium]|nr:hypothetical protein [Terriglobales bacterium]